MKYQEYKELSDAMEQAAHKFYQLRYQMSNGGNLSMRVPGHDWMLVKATDVAFDEVCAGRSTCAKQAWYWRKCVFI